MGRIMAIINIKEDYYYLISKKRQEMIQLGLAKGFHHDDTIHVSQQLDVLIYNMQKIHLKTKYH